MPYHILAPWICRIRDCPRTLHAHGVCICTGVETIDFIAEMITDEVKEEAIHAPIYPNPKVHQFKLINTGSSVLFLPIH